MLKFAEIAFFRFVRADDRDLLLSEARSEQSKHSPPRVVDRVENTNFERRILYVFYLPRLPLLSHLSICGWSRIQRTGTSHARLAEATTLRTEQVEFRPDQWSPHSAD